MIVECTPGRIMDIPRQPPIRKGPQIGPVGEAVLTASAGVVLGLIGAALLWFPIARTLFFVTTGDLFVISFGSAAFFIGLTVAIAVLTKRTR